MDSTLMKEFRARINNLEKRDNEEFLALLEIMSNITFFGGIKKTNCEYAKMEQCSLFHLQNEAKSRIPLATECRITDCESPYNHCHVEISNMTCAFCPHWKKDQTTFKMDEEHTSRGKESCQE